MTSGDRVTSRLSPVQLAHFFQALQGPPEWRAREGIKTAAGIHFGGHYIEIQGDLDVSRLTESWRQLVRSEPVLRTAFSATEVSRPVQYVYPDVGRAAESAVELVDWSRPGTDLTAELSGFRAQAAGRGLDLETPPLARLLVARIAPRLHWMLMVAHAVILDEWSVGLLWHRLLRHYDGAPGQLTGGFPEYAELLRRRGIGDAERFWADALQGYYLPVHIGDDEGLASPGEPVATRKTLALPVGDELSALLAEGGAASGLAPETFVYAAFGLALSRYSGEPDVVIGADLPGRDHLPGLAELPGPFRNAVPLRITIDENDSVGDLLSSVDSTRRAVIAHEYVPEPLIREWSDRRLARDWLFAHVAATGSGAVPVPRLKSLAASAEPLTPQLPPRPLGITWRWQNARLSCEVGYCNTMIGDLRAQQFGQHLLNLIHGLAADPGRRVRNMPMLTEDERGRLPGSAHRASGSRPARERIEDLILPWADAQPETVAVRGESYSLTYRELTDRAARWAAALSTAGIGAGDVVGVHMRRTPELVAALLGTLLAGAAYLPLDPGYPAARLAAIAGDAGIAALADDTGTAPAELSANRLRLAPPPPGGTTPSATRAGGADDLAYIFYTSGSTGRPKGVEICHRNTVNLLRWAIAELGDDLLRFLATTSVNFDCSILEVFGTLSAGGTVFLAPGPLSGPVLRAAEGATIINGVPSVVADALRGSELPASVRTVILGGEPPSPGLIERIRESGQVRRILNLYGPTETTSYSTFAEIKGPLTHPPSIGRPIASTRTYVLDRYENPVPVGVTGELYIGGAGVARGYRGLPELTAERFLPGDQLGGITDGRVYRTGDLVQATADGELLFIGRADNQVKIHGVRVELGEVEFWLRTVDGVADGAVLAVPGTGGRPAALTAWVVPAAGACPDGDQVRARLAELLPSAMVPTRIVMAAELPRTPTGKLDKQALGAASVELPDGGAGVAPRTPLEKWLAEVWAELLDLPEVGITDDFFDLGGDSFVAMRMIGQAQERGLPAEPADIYTSATIESLAAVLTARSASGIAAGAAPGTASP